MMKILLSTTAKTSEQTTTGMMLNAHILDGASAIQTASSSTTWNSTGITVAAQAERNSATMTAEIMGNASPAQTIMETMFMQTTMSATMMDCQMLELQLVLLNALASIPQIQNTA